MKKYARDLISIRLWAWVMGLLLVSGGVIAKDQSHWLTMVGMPGEPNHDTIEVQPASIATTPNQSSLNVRVNRSTPSSSSEGIPFRSYTATILIDCAEKTARFTTAEFYMMPMWEGKPHKTVAWSAAEVRPVLFRNFKPNPRDKIIRAACNNAIR